jgi:hypothetical protein
MSLRDLMPHVSQHLCKRGSRLMQIFNKHKCFWHIKLHKSKACKELPHKTPPRIKIFKCSWLPRIRQRQNNTSPEKKGYSGNRLHVICALPFQATRAEKNNDNQYTNVSFVYCIYTKLIEKQVIESCVRRAQIMHTWQFASLYRYSSCTCITYKKDWDLERLLTVKLDQANQFIT